MFYALLFGFEKHIIVAPASKAPMHPNKLLLVATLELDATNIIPLLAMLITITQYQILFSVAWVNVKC